MIKSKSKLTETGGVQPNRTGTANSNGYETMLAELKQDPRYRFYARLVETEPTINWIEFADKLYRKSRSTNTIGAYCAGICKFKEYLKEEYYEDSKDEEAKEVTIAGIVKDLGKAEDKNAIYKLLDDFSGWCDRQGLRPYTSRSYVQSVKKLLLFLDIEIDYYKFKSKVGLPKAKGLKDEYPDNATIRAIMSNAPANIRLLVQTMCDIGPEPIDIAQLQPKNFHFDESPVRGVKDRQKTGESLEFWLNKETADAIQQKIKNENLGPNDFIFVEKFTKSSVGVLRVAYNTAVCRAGFGKIVQTKTSYYGVVDKIDNHSFGKLHMKVFKKRWFSLAIAAGVPEYIVQGMLGRKKYLDEYSRQPLQVKQQFARKILRIVSVYATEKNEEEQLEELSKVLGVEKVTAEQKARIKDVLGLFMKLGPSKIKELLKTEE